MPWIKYSVKYRALAHNMGDIFSANAGVQFNCE
jgi:hypothetical protein